MLHGPINIKTILVSSEIIVKFVDYRIIILKKIFVSF